MSLAQYVLVLVMMGFKKTAANIAEMSDKVSHDQVTRALNQDGLEKKHLESITKPRGLKGGYLIIDDTISEKPYGSEFDGASFVYSSAKGKAVFGYQIVLLIWTDGKRRIVLDYRTYQKGGPSKLDFALERLSYARNRLKIKPSYVLFDSWYAAKKLLKRICDYGWYFVTRLKKNRTLDKVKLSKFRNYPRWLHLGELTGGIKVSVVRNDNNYFATNRLSLSRREILKTYKIRQHIEEFIKQMKYFGLCDCQMRSLKAQNNHMFCCICALSLVEKESAKLKLSTYKTRKLIILGRRHLPKSSVEALMKAA